jgi:hypothetical protein
MDITVSARTRSHFTANVWTNFFSLYSYSLCIFGFHFPLTTQGGPNIGENLANVLNNVDEDEDITSTSSSPSNDDNFVDPYEPVVTKIKSFDLSKPISVKEAIFALDYIDHDFYVFRDEETNEISVVYKRNAGGVGLIQPSPTSS